MNFNGEKRYQRFVELSREREELFRKKSIMENSHLGKEKISGE